MGIFGDIFKRSGRRLDTTYPEGDFAPEPKEIRKDRLDMQGSPRTVYPTGKNPSEQKEKAESEGEQEPAIELTPVRPRVQKSNKWVDIMAEIKSADIEERRKIIYGNPFDVAHEVQSVRSVLANVEREMFTLGQSLKAGEIVLRTADDVQKAVDYIDKHSGAFNILGGFRVIQGMFLDFVAQTEGFGKIQLSLREIREPGTSKHPTWKVLSFCDNSAGGTRYKLNAEQVNLLRQLSAQVCKSSKEVFELCKAVSDTVECLKDTQRSTERKDSMCAALNAYYADKCGAWVYVHDTIKHATQSGLYLKVDSEHSYYIQIKVPVYLNTVGNVESHMVPALISQELAFSQEGQLTDQGPLCVEIRHYEKDFSKGIKKDMLTGASAQLTRTAMELYVL